jgi:uncharacterized protein YecA (UPF0149 family)
MTPKTQPEKTFQGRPPSRSALIIQQRHLIGRNQMCLCGSGKRYKRCCMYESTTKFRQKIMANIGEK